MHRAYTQQQVDKIVREIVKVVYIMQPKPVWVYMRIRSRGTREKLKSYGIVSSQKRWSE